MDRFMRYFLYSIPGGAIGAIGFAIGAYIASEGDGFTSAIYYSTVGLICAPLATLAWATRSMRRRQIFAGIALLGGFLASVSILLQLSHDSSSIADAALQSPIAFGAWFAIWLLWFSLAVVRLILFSPAHTVHRLRRRKTRSPNRLATQRSSESLIIRT